MEIGSIIEIFPKDLFKEHQAGDGKYPLEKDDCWNFNYFNTGRAAIEALLNNLKKEGYKKVWLPSYDCSSVYDAAKRAGIEIALYAVDKDLLIDNGVFDSLQRNDILYLVNFFGREETERTYKAIRKAKDNGVVVIEDLSLSLLSAGENIGFGDYVIGSARKWLPIPDGGFIASRQCLPQFTKADAANDYTLYYFAAQVMKSQYLQDTTLDKQVFLNLSNKGMEKLFSDYTIREISEISKRVIDSTNLNEVAEIRKINYNYLYECLCNIKEVKLMVEPSTERVALGMVMCVVDRDALFKHLIQNGVYCNIHWRENESTAQFEDSRYLSQHCLTLPCDQRYGIEQMNHIYKTIKDFYHHV